MIVKRFGCTTIHNKALYKCTILSYKDKLIQRVCFKPFFILNMLTVIADLNWFEGLNDKAIN